MARFTQQDIEYIRESYIPGKSSVDRGNGQQLAEAFKTTRGNIWAIARNKLWKHI